MLEYWSQRFLQHELVHKKTYRTVGRIMYGNHLNNILQSLVFLAIIYRIITTLLLSGSDLCVRLWTTDVGVVLLIGYYPTVNHHNPSCIGYLWYKCICWWTQCPYGTNAWYKVHMTLAFYSPSLVTTITLMLWQMVMGNILPLYVTDRR